MDTVKRKKLFKFMKETSSMPEQKDFSSKTEYGEALNVSVKSSITILEKFEWDETRAIPLIKMVKKESIKRFMGTYEDHLSKYDHNKPEYEAEKQKARELGELVARPLQDEILTHAFKDMDIKMQ